MPNSPNTPHKTNLPNMTYGEPATKLLTLEALVAARARARFAGRRVVQCHGCFDIVHPGHIRHLRQARALGDVLLVTITGDGGIAKGAGRPLIPEELRAENLIALDCVDWVYIDGHATAMEVLQTVQPDIYMKGKEYENNHDPRFAAERAVVERGGGRVVFSSGDVVFSSTALIAALQDSGESPYHQRLSQLARQEELSAGALQGVLASFKNKRVVVIGESIIDSYIMCAPPRIASESPVLALRPVEARHYDGGAAVVARHCAAMGATVSLITPIPHVDDGEASAMLGRLMHEGIKVHPICTGVALPEKQRYLVGTQKMMKLDLVQPLVLDQTQHDQILQLAADVVGAYADAVIITDFGLGLFTSQLLRRLCKALRPRAGVISGDTSSATASLRSMRGVDLLTPSEQELRDAMQLQTEGLTLVVDRLMTEQHVSNVIVTLGADGLIGFRPLRKDSVARNSEDKSHGSATSDDALPIAGNWSTRLASEHIPALAPAAVDPLGCGDALLAAATLSLTSGASLAVASYLGSLAAGVQVQRLGNIAVSAADLRQAIARVQSSRLVVGSIPADQQARASTGFLRATA